MRIKMLKKWSLLLILSVFLATYCVPFTVLSESAYTSQSLPQSAKTELYNRIYNGLKNRETSISLRDISITEREFETDVFPTAERIKAENPELFYVGQNMSISYKSGAYYFSMNYTMTSAQVTAAMAVYEVGIAKMVKGVDNTWSDVQKVTYISDYITHNFKYDTDLKIFDTYNFIKTGKGVCQSYHGLFTAAMKELGIPVSYAISDEMNHIWSMVKVDGEWYHIDVTHNDPVADRVGHSFHTNMLMSDTECAKTHKPWVSDYKATSTKYDNFEWENIQTPFVYLGGKAYAIDSKTGYLVTFDFKTGKTTNVQFIAVKWKTGMGMSYEGCYSSLTQYGGLLYFNDDDEIFAFDVAKNKKTTIAQKNGSGFIYGFIPDENKLTYYLAPNPNVEATAANTITLENVVTYTATFKASDKNVSQNQYVAGETITIPTSPTKQGYKFIGWSPSVPSKMPAANIIFEALFECKHEKTLTQEAEARCIHDGFIKHICTTCGDIVSNTTIKATGIHTYGEWTQNETERQRVCNVCGEVEKEAITKHETSEAVSMTEASKAENQSQPQVAESSEAVVNEDSTSSEANIISIRESNPDLVSIANNEPSDSLWIIIVIGVVAVVVITVVVIKKRA